MKRYFLITLAMALTGTSALAADLSRPAFALNLSLSPLDVIDKNGQLKIMDGSTVYILKKGGSFLSFPLGMSGFSIEGTWKQQDGDPLGLTVLVEGRWLAVNQVSRNDDFRTMQLVIHPGVLQDTGHPDEDIYKCTLTAGVATERFQAHALKIAPLPPAKMTFDQSG